MTYLILICFIVAIDLCAKSRVRKLIGTDTKEIIPGLLHFTVVTNSGMAYSILQAKPIVVRWLSGSGIFLFVLYLFKALSGSPTANTTEKFALSLIIGGALGNFIDRMQNGGVTDYIRLKWKKSPVFNIADMCILVGAIFYLFTIFTQHSGRK